jgi:cytidylate kinase
LADDERQQSWLLDCIEAFASAPELSQGRYVRALIGVVRALGEQGRGVIVGRAAAYILPPASTLRVRLVGERDDRITQFSGRLHIKREQAAHQLEELGRERAHFIREHFHAEPDDHRHYDLVLNTSHWSPADCADFIQQALHHKAAGRTSS